MTKRLGGYCKLTKAMCILIALLVYESRFYKNMYFFTKRIKKYIGIMNKTFKNPTATTIIDLQRLTANLVLHLTLSEH
ncbi:23719_t:CDS:1, partial [Gigaspora margarita]